MVSSILPSHTNTFLLGLSTQPAVLVQVTLTQGSVPREAGTWMAVFIERVIGTIGGGHLEHQAIAHARALLGQVVDVTPDQAPSFKQENGDEKERAGESMRFSLGPSLGQCCGGVVQLYFEQVGSRDVPALKQRLARRLTPVALFGGGHVGHALVQALAPLPFQLTWIDSRDGVFADPVPENVLCEYSEPVQAAVPALTPLSRVLIMSFSHAEDLDVVAACLTRQRVQGDLPFIGLIGSKTKWATFRHRLEARGFTKAELAHLSCPIGVAGITGKEPEVIAVAVAAQLLQTINAG